MAERYVIGFRAPSWLPGTWFVLDEHTNQCEAEAALPGLIADDVNEGAPVGCEWRITRQRGAEQIGTVKLIRMTKDGPAEQSAT